MDQIEEIINRANQAIDAAEDLKQLDQVQIGRAHVWTPVTDVARMPSSAWKKKKTKKKIKKRKKKKYTSTIRNLTRI